jgi:hypothetical protein
LDRYKAILVAKWFFQTHGVDFGETFTLVAKLFFEAMFDFEIV